ncbi:hypothetical protein [Bacillus niameyensis]|uniref:hypothetical protein n=1 Tax=Bacillus niameyensis TaxID=1522308 RepID=UPI000781B5EC|nr:hypothetical protein [Bacillus niameyensis]
MNFGDYIFRRLIPGTIVTVTMDSGNFIGPAVFTEYDTTNGIVTLEEQGAISPPTSSIVKFGASKVESISFQEIE